MMPDPWNRLTTIWRTDLATPNRSPSSPCSISKSYPIVTIHWYPYKISAENITLKFHSLKLPIAREILEWSISRPVFVLLHLDTTKFVPYIKMKYMINTNNNFVNNRDIFLLLTKKIIDN